MGPYSQMKRNYHDVFINKLVENPKLLGENTEELMRQLKQRNKQAGLQNDIDLENEQGEVNKEIETEQIAS